MEPHILSGVIVACSEDWTGIETNGKIMSFQTWEGITLKKLVEDAKNRVTWLMPINHEFTPLPYTENGEETSMIGILDIAIRSFNRTLAKDARSGNNIHFKYNAKWKFQE